MLLSGNPLMWVEWVSPEQSTPIVRSVLDSLKSRHTDNFGWALACCRWQRDMAEDVLQEAYLRVLDGRAVYAGRSSDKTWFFAVIKRVAGELQRRQQRRAILSLRRFSAEAPLHEPVAEQSCPAGVILRDEASSELRAALIQLSTRQREVLHLVFYGELTLEEAAEALDISTGSARTHYHRGKLRLAEILSMGEDDDEAS